MSTLSPYYSHVAVATAALGFAHSYTLLALDGDPSRLLLEAAIGDAKTALAYLIHACNALETNQEKGTGTAKAPCGEFRLKVG